ncbi:MAG: glutamate-1-semialdehyde 2,1-aminomutase [Vampirovibrionales bacterium]|nr:glutamate-1-semialdehyde 2,1-aminomutase [Vampirovibrionales bacterium]
MPGGVNSPVRAFKGVGGAPVFMQRALGPYLWDEDGNRYIDYVGSWGPAILGHAYPDVIRRIQQAAEDGLSFGAPTLLETALAHQVIDMMPAIEKIRFVNSGTEACMSAIRLARAFTGRSRIITFAGCYHGHGDSFLSQAGSGAATLGIPASPGVPPAIAALTLSARFNDLASVERLLASCEGDAAAIMVEPVAGNMGCIAPEPGFLQGLRELADRHGALLIFDEVMCGFRVARGGAQERYGVRPDLTTLGKIIGGGMPVGAYGGRRDIMACVAPEGRMYQAGTLSGNPLAMTAGLETLRRLNDHGFYADLDDKTHRLADGLREIAQQAGVSVTINAVCGMLTLFFGDGPVIDYESATACDRERFRRFFHAMLDRGVYLAPSPFESLFVSIAHDADDITATLAAARESFRLL